MSVTARPSKPRSAALIRALGAAIGGVMWFAMAAGPAIRAADAFTVTAIGDASVRSTSPNTRYGTATTIRTRGGSQIYRAFVGFQVTGLSAAPASVRLRLFVTDGSRDAGRVHLVANGWSEATITWNLAPSIDGPVVATLGAVAASRWVEVDVTSAVTTNGTYSFGLESASTDSAIYSSRETTNGPVLIVTPSATSSPSPSPSVSAAPSASAGASPSAAPSAAPSASASVLPSASPSASPSAAPSATTSPSVSPTGSPPPTATQSFAPVADANIKSSSPATNYGVATTLRVLNATEIYRTYLRFNVSGLTGNVSSAKLRLYVTDASPDGGNLYSVSNDWGETTITWNNAPPITGGEIAAAGSVALGTWVELDVTPLVTGAGMVSFGMTSLSTNSAIYGSRQSGTPPALVVITGGTALPMPNASFTASPTAGRAPLAVTFSDASSGSPATWAWDFQADGSIDSNERNPVAVYRLPGTYSVRLTVGNATGTDSILRSGLVSVASGPTTDPLDPVLVGAGDIASCGSTGDELTAALLDGQSGTVFTTGDNVYDSGTTAEYANCYEPSWGRHRSRTRPVPGNHEYNTPGATGYYTYFGSAAGTASEGWYSYDLGDWHVIALNSNCSAIGGCGTGSPMETWLRADLAAHASTCTLAYWHHPLFSGGGHGNDPSMRPIWDVLDNAGAELVLNGHDHDYERFAPQHSNGVAAANGIREIVVGTGGKSLVGFKTLLANSETRSSTTYGVLRLILHGSGYTWDFLPATSGGFVDAGSDVCH